MIAHFVNKRNSVCLTQFFGLALALFAGTSLICSSLVAQVAPNTSTPTFIDNVGDVIKNWTPNRHLFVKGDLGVNEQHLEELEQWLDSNAPHWVVVLMQNANDEIYASKDGSAYRGMDAVEQALGHEIYNQTDFGKQVHPESNERDGAIFVLFLQERKFSYYSSEAQDRRALGPSNWIGRLDQPAIQAMRSGGKIVDAVKDTILPINRTLSRKIHSEATRVRNLLATTLAVAVIIVAATLWIMNRRRRKIMKAAIDTLTERDDQVSKETEGIDHLFTRNEELLGSKSKIVERGYVGATRELSEQALEYVDDLFIMSKETRRVLAEAKGLVYPSNPISKLLNLFSGSRYQQAVNLVTGKPLNFSRLNGLPLVLRERFTAPGSTDSPPPVGADFPDEITMTFADVFKAFKQRGVDAERALNTVEKCLTSVHETLTAAQLELQKCVEQDKQLESESKTDNYFALPDYLESLIPSVESDLAEADRISAFDAVTAMQDFLPKAQRKMAEATQLGNHLLSARQKLFPPLKVFADKLRDLQFQSLWIDAELGTLAVRSNALMKSAVERSIADDTAAIHDDLSTLLLRAEESVQIAQRIRTELYPQGEALKNRIAAVRSKLAVQLSLPESAVLHEINQVPDEHWSTAGASLDAAGVSVSLGQNSAAKAAIDAMLAEIAQADILVEASTKAVQSFEQDQQTIASNFQRLETRLPQVRGAVDSVRQRYASSTLQMRSSLPPVLADTPSPPPNSPIVVGPDRKEQSATPETADQLLLAAAAPQQSVGGLLKLAYEEHRVGKVLHSASVRHDAASQVATAHVQLDRIESLLARIESQARENETQLKHTVGLLQNLAANQRDPLVMQSTLDAIRASIKAAENLGHGLVVQSSAPDPFEIATNLESLQQSVLELDARCTADRQAHAEAARAVAGARRQLEIAQQFVRQSQTDGIPDSQQTQIANNRIASLSQSLVLVESQLRDEHGDWKAVDAEAARLQADLSKASDTLKGELQSASQALSIFQQASQTVYQAEQWAGSYGIRVLGSPGVRELERARASLQQGNYSQVLEVGRMAVAAALVAIQQAEREVQRRQLAAEREAEAERRRREADLLRNSPSMGPINISGGGFGGAPMSGGLFGGGGASFGSGSNAAGSSSVGSSSGGSSSGGSSSGGSSSAGSSSGGSSGSGFSRSGW